METPTQAIVPGAVPPPANVPAGAVPPAVPAQTGQSVANNSAPVIQPTISGNGHTYTQEQVSKAYAAGSAEQRAAFDAKTGTTGGQLRGTTTVTPQAPVAPAPAAPVGPEVPQGFTSFDTSAGKNLSQPAAAQNAPIAPQTAQGAAEGQPKAPAQPQSPKDVAASIFAQNPNAKVTDFQKFINDSGKAGTPEENKVWDAYHEYTHMQLGLNKYGSSDVNSLASAISSGDLAVGSPTWNALTVHNPNAAAAKAKYEADLRTKTNNELASKLVGNEGGKSVTSAVSGNTLENLSDKITSKVSDPFQIYSLADALAQNPEVLANKQKVLASDAKIDDLTKAKMRNYEGLKKQYPNVPQSVLMGMEAKMDKDLDEQIYNEQRDRNYAAGMLSYYSDIAQSQVQARNEIAKEQRQQLFTQQNQQAAFANQAALQNAQFAQQKGMAEFQAGLKPEEIGRTIDPFTGQAVPVYGIRQSDGSYKRIEVPGQGNTTPSTSPAITSWGNQNVPKEGFTENVQLQRTGTNVARDTNNPGNITADSIPAGMTKQQYAEKIGATGTYKSPNGREYFVFPDAGSGMAALQMDIMGKQSGKTQVAVLKNQNATLGDYLRAHVGSKMDENSPYAQAVMNETGAMLDTKFRSIDANKLMNGIAKAEGWSPSKASPVEMPKETPSIPEFDAYLANPSMQNKKMAMLAAGNFNPQTFDDTIRKYQGDRIGQLYGPDMQKAAQKYGLSPEQMNKVQAVLDYSAEAPKLNSRSPDAAKVIAAVKEINPDFSPATFAQRQQAVKSLGDSSKGDGLIVSAANTAIGHLSFLHDIFDNIGNTGVQPVNAWKNFFQQAAGDPNITQVQTVLNAVSPELAKIYKPNVTDSEIEHFASTFGSKLAPAQMKAAIETQIDLMSSKLESVGNKYIDAKTKQPWYPDAKEQIYQPDTVAALGKMGYRINDRFGVEKDAGNEKTYTLPAKWLDVGENPNQTESEIKNKAMSAYVNAKTQAEKDSIRKGYEQLMQELANQ